MNSLENRKLNKKHLWNLIAKKLNHSIHRLHIFSIINLLIDELFIHLNNGGKIDIPNFGILEVKQIKSKKIRSIASGQIKFVKKTKVLRFSLARKFIKFLSKKSINDIKKVNICEEKQDP